MPSVRCACCKLGGAVGPVTVPIGASDSNSKTVEVPYGGYECPTDINDWGDRYIRTVDLSVGECGGNCTCPSGTAYEVGDNVNNCGSLACFGGVAGPGSCSCPSRRWRDPRAGMKVSCGPSKRGSFAVSVAENEINVRRTDTDGGWSTQLEIQCDSTAGAANDPPVPDNYCESYVGLVQGKKFTKNIGDLPKCYGVDPLGKLVPNAVCLTMFGGRPDTQRNVLQGLLFVVSVAMYTIQIGYCPENFRAFDLETWLPKYGDDGFPTNSICSDPSMSRSVRDLPKFSLSCQIFPIILLFAILLFSTWLFYVHFVRLPRQHGDGPPRESVPWPRDKNRSVQRAVGLIRCFWYHLGGIYHDPLGVYNWAMRDDPDGEKSKLLKLNFRARLSVRAVQLGCSAASPTWRFWCYGPTEWWLRIARRPGWTDDTERWLTRAQDVLTQLPATWADVGVRYGEEGQEIARAELGAAFLHVPRATLDNDAIEGVIRDDDGATMILYSLDQVDLQINRRLCELGATLTLSQLLAAWKARSLPAVCGSSRTENVTFLLRNTFQYGRDCDRTKMLREVFLHFRARPKYPAGFSGAIVAAVRAVCTEGAATTGHDGLLCQPSSKGGFRNVLGVVLDDYLGGKFHFFPFISACTPQFCTASGRSMATSTQGQTLLNAGDPGPLLNEGSLLNSIDTWAWNNSLGRRLLTYLIGLVVLLTVLIIFITWQDTIGESQEDNFIGRALATFQSSTANDDPTGILGMLVFVVAVVLVLYGSLFVSLGMLYPFSSSNVAGWNEFSPEQVVTELSAKVLEWEPDFALTSGGQKGRTLAQILVARTIERRVEGRQPASENSDPSLHTVFANLETHLPKIMMATDTSGQGWIHTAGQKFADGEISASGMVDVVSFFAERSGTDSLGAVNKKGETVIHTVFRGVPGANRPSAPQAATVCRALLERCPKLTTEGTVRPRDFADMLALSGEPGARELLDLFETRLFDRYRLVGLDLETTTYTSATARVYQCQDIASCDPEESSIAVVPPKTVVLKLMRLPQAWRRELLALQAIRAIGKSDLFILPESAATCGDDAAQMQKDCGVPVAVVSRVLAKGTVDQRLGGGGFDVLSEINNQFRQGICMPMGGRSLFLIINCERLAAQPVVRIQSIVLDLLEGLKTLHDAGLRHGDVKPMNVLLHNDRYKLIDFDMCVQRGTPMKMIEPRKLLGSSAYLPPELFHYAISAAGPDRGTSTPVRDDSWDLWGLGCTLYEMVSSGTPFFPKCERGNGGDQISEMGQALLDKLFYKQTRFKDLEEQIESISCYRSQFETEIIVEFLDKLLEPDPAKRMTVEEARAHRFCSYSTFEVTSPVAPKSTADVFAAEFDQIEDDLNAAWTDDEATEVFKKATTVLENVLREVCAAQSTALHSESTLGHCIKVVAGQTWCPFDRAHVLQDDLQKLLKHRNSCVHDRMSIPVVTAKLHARSCRNAFQALARARCFEPKGPTELSEIFAADLDEYDTELQHARTSADATEWFKKAATALENMLREVCSAKRVQFRPDAGLGTFILAIYKQDWCPFNKIPVTKKNKHGAFEKLLDHRNSCTHDGMSIPVGTARAHMLLCKKVLHQLTEARCFEPATMYPGTIDFSGQLLAVAFKDGQQRPVRRLRDGPTYELTIPATAAGKSNFGFRISHKSDSNARDYQVDGVDVSWWAAGFTVRHDRSDGATKLVASGGLGELDCTLI